MKVCIQSTIRLLFIPFTLTGLSGCQHDDNDNAAPVGGNNPALLAYTVGGSVSGLVGTGLVLQNNGEDNLTLTADGDFTFAAKIDDGGAYSVAVSAQPGGQSCVVSNGTGTVAAANVNNVVVVCSTTSSTVTLEIDATAGGRGTKPNDPENKYTYINLDSSQVLGLTDGDAATSRDWHIAFKRTSMKLNGGVSGPGGVEGAVVDTQDDFYDSNGNPNSSVFLNASAEGELTAFNNIISTDGLSFVEDRDIAAIKGDGSNESWWRYSGPPSHNVSANSNQWWLIRSSSGDSYAKFHVTDIVQASRDITLEIFIQSAADSVFSTTATTWMAFIGTDGGSKCYDIDAAAETDCVNVEWDIKVEVAGQSWNIWTNGGVSGSGSGGAFGPFDVTAISDYTSGTASGSGTNITTMYEQDSAGGVFKDNSWYAYNLQGNNKLWPNYRVYAIDTGAAKYKLQILSFYNAAGTSGHITLRYAPLLGSETVNVILKEWSVSLDKTTVNAGNVNFRVTNSGPIDVHEFVVIKTDLAPDQLPVDANGVVDESGTGIEIIGEIEGISVSTQVHVTSMDLAPGNYVLICNIWDDGEQESHYHEGMRVAFTVQ